MRNVNGTAANGFATYQIRPRVDVPVCAGCVIAHTAARPDQRSRFVINRSAGFERAVDFGTADGRTHFDRGSSGIPVLTWPTFREYDPVLR